MIPASSLSWKREMMEKDKKSMKRKKKRQERRERRGIPLSPQIKNTFQMRCFSIPPFSSSNNVV